MTVVINLLLQGVELLARFCPAPQLSTADETSTTDSTSGASPWIGLKVLNLSFNKLGVACGRGLATLLSQCKCLHNLCLTSCRLGSGTFDQSTGLDKALKGNYMYMMEGAGVRKGEGKCGRQ